MHVAGSLHRLAHNSRPEMRKCCWWHRLLVSYPNVSFLLAVRGLVGSILVVSLLAWSGGSARAELYAGACEVDITPPKPVALQGQFHLRISTGIETPLKAAVLALETRRGDEPLDAAVFVACDLTMIEDVVYREVRAAVQETVPGLHPTKVILSATHTHTAPTLLEGRYKLPATGVMPVAEYRKLLVDRLSRAVKTAWQNRSPASWTFGLSDAVVGRNRRAVYFDGSAQMYGRTNLPEFRGLEGPEDHDVGTLFVWNREGKLLAVAINVACPAQEVESRHTINADYWHPVRETLKQRFGQEVCVLGWIGAAGDQSPHLMYNRSAEDRMRQLRGISRTKELARRIVRAVIETWETVQKSRYTDSSLVHRVVTLELPMRKVTPEEYAEAKARCEELEKAMAADPRSADRHFARFQWYKRTVDRYQQQQSNPNPTLTTEIHVVRLGDVAICTNRFELFTEYGLRIKARSPAVQTFIIQLAGPGSYLPTQRAVDGGGYSAVVHSCLVGPEGGQMLVDRTVAELKKLWQ